MKNLICTLILGVIFAISGLAQQVQPDSLYQDIVQNYNVILEKIDSENRAERDSVLAMRADDFAALFDQFPESEIAQKALESSFKAWLNTDQYDKQALYIRKVSPESALWHDLAFWYSLGLSNQRKSPKVFITFLKNALAKNLENKASLSFIHTELGKYQNGTNKNKDSAIYHFEKVLELDVDSFEVKAAKRDLHDLRNLNVGQPAPEFTARDLKGNTIGSDQLRGRFVLLEFWATWCGPCIPEIPYLKEVYNEYGNRDDFVMIGISLDKDRETLEKFLVQEEIKWTQILDEGGDSKWTGNIGTLFSVGNGIPKSYLLDNEGIIIARDLRKKSLNEELSKYLD